MTDTNHKPKANTRRKKSKRSEKFFVRLPSDMKRAMGQIADRDERSLSQVARLALREYVATHAELR